MTKELVDDHAITGVIIFFLCFSKGQLHLDTLVLLVSATTDDWGRDRVDMGRLEQLMDSGAHSFCYSK